MTNTTSYMAGQPTDRLFDYDFTFGWTDADRALLSRLQSFIPDKVFDAHCHLHNVDFFPDDRNIFRAYGTADAKRCLADQRELYGDRKFRGLLLATPSVCFREHPEWRLMMNDWMNEQMNDAPDCVGTVYVVPGDTKEQIEGMIKHPLIRGFKCYHQTSTRQTATFFSDVWEYLPETAWEVANEREMSITVHMVKPAALADEANMTYFKQMTAKYPHAKLILAHCARGFASWTTVEKARELAGIPNIYYDMGAICDPATIFELIRQVGPEHVMWGTDYHVDRAHGRPINCGETFTWLYSHELPEGVHIPLCKTVLEALFAFWQASLMLDLSRGDLEQVFYKTGTDLFGLKD